VPTWSVTPTTYATINSSGDLAAQAIPENQNITIVAEYALGGITRTATRAAVIINTANSLGVMLSGNGVGAIYGTVGTDLVIDCTTPHTGTCISSLPVGSFVHLSAVPNPDSIFDGWGSQCGVCSGNSCQVDLYSDNTCGASFIILPPTRIGGTQYPSLKAAYLAASNNAIIQSKATTFSGGLVFDRGIAVTVRGGYDAGYSTQMGYSLVEGKLTVATGSVVVDRLVIR
jgi:O-acetyl-ADP-ribose deacetylase (regulator of RNase III)